MFWGHPDTGQLSEIDLLVLEAFEYYEAGICKGCGQPLAHTSDLNNMREWDLAEITCHACELLENTRKNQNAPVSGLKTYIKNLMSWRG